MPFHTMVFRYFSLYEYVPTIDLCILATTIYVYMTSLEMISFSGVMDIW